MRQNVEKLPKWARMEIERLDRDVKHMRRKIEEIGQGTGAIAVDCYSETPVRFGERCPVSFGRDSMRTFVVKMTEDGIYVMGDRPLVVEPGSANTVTLKLKDFTT